MPRKIFILNFPLNHREFIVFARHVVTCLTGNLRFSHPPVPLADLTALIDVLEAAKILVETKVAGAADDRDAKRKAVEVALRQEEAYVESVAQQVPPQDVESTVTSSGFSLKKHSPEFPKYWPRLSFVGECGNDEKVRCFSGRLPRRFACSRRVCCSGLRSLASSRRWFWR